MCIYFTVILATMRSNKISQKRYNSSSIHKKKDKNKERKKYRTKGRGGAEHMKGSQPTGAGRIAGLMTEMPSRGKIGHGSQLRTKFTFTKPKTVCFLHKTIL